MYARMLCLGTIHGVHSGYWERALLPTAPSTEISWRQGGPVAMETKFAEPLLVPRQKRYVPTKGAHDSNKPVRS